MFITYVYYCLSISLIVILDLLHCTGLFAANYANVPTVCHVAFVWNLLILVFKWSHDDDDGY